MRPDDRKAFLEVIVGFAELKGRQLSTPAIELYWHAMRGWRLQDFRDAAAVLLRTCEFMPTPADFEKLKRAQQPTSGEAWAEALIRCTSWRTRTESIDRVDRAARCVGGYRSLAFADVEHDLPHVQRRFIEAYETLGESEEIRTALPNLILPRLTGGH